MSNRICNIIVAAGSGSRYGSDIPKQFCDMNGRPVLMTTIERLRHVGGEMILVLSPQWFDFWTDQCEKHSFLSPRVVGGGETRWESVRNALMTVSENIDIVSVHDGARPLVTKDIALSAIEAVVRGADGAIPAVAVTDSLRKLTADGHSEMVDRSMFRAVQTPQVFEATRLKKAYSLPYNPLFTDDASVMEAAGYTNIVLTPGSVHNIKITNPGDIALACFLLSEKA